MVIHLPRHLIVACFCLASTLALADQTADDVGPADAQTAGVVVLGDDADAEIVSCVERALERAIQKSESALRLIPAAEPDDEIRRAFFPWLEFEERDEVPEVLSFLSQHPLAQQRREETGLRYLVLVGGQTTESAGGVNFGTCTYSGCLGYGTIDRESNVSAVIWDLDFTDFEQSLSATKSGTIHIPALLVPIPILIRTQGPACKALAEQITTQLITLTNATPDERASPSDPPE